MGDTWYNPDDSFTPPSSSDDGGIGNPGPPPQDNTYTPPDNSSSGTDNTYAEANVREHYYSPDMGETSNAPIGYAGAPATDTTDTTTKKAQQAVDNGIGNPGPPPQIDNAPTPAGQDNRSWWERGKDLLGSAANEVKDLALMGPQALKDTIDAGNRPWEDPGAFVKDAYGSAAGTVGNTIKDAFDVGSRIQGSAAVAANDLKRGNFGQFANDINPASNAYYAVTGDQAPWMSDEEYTTRNVVSRNPAAAILPGSGGSGEGSQVIPDNIPVIGGDTQYDLPIVGGILRAGQAVKGAFTDEGQGPSLDVGALQNDIANGMSFQQAAEKYKGSVGAQILSDLINPVNFVEVPGVGEAVASIFTTKTARALDEIASTTERLGAWSPQAADATKQVVAARGGYDLSAPNTVERATGIQMDGTAGLNRVSTAPDAASAIYQGASYLADGNEVMATNLATRYAADFAATPEGVLDTMQRVANGVKYDFDSRGITANVSNALEKKSQEILALSGDMQSVPMREAAAKLGVDTNRLMQQAYSANPDLAARAVEARQATAALAAQDIVRGDLKAGWYAEAGYKLPGTESQFHQGMQGLFSIVRGLMLAGSAPPLALQKFSDEWFRAMTQGTMAIRLSDTAIGQALARNIEKRNVLGLGEKAQGFLDRSTVGNLIRNDVLPPPAALRDVNPVTFRSAFTGKNRYGEAIQPGARFQAVASPIDKWNQSLISAPTQHVVLNALYQDTKRLTGSAEMAARRVAAAMQAAGYSPEMVQQAYERARTATNPGEVMNIANLPPVVPERGMAVGTPVGRAGAPTRAVEPRGRSAPVAERPLPTPMNPTNPQSVLDRFTQNMTHYPEGNPIRESPLAAAPRDAALKQGITLPEDATNQTLVDELAARRPYRDLGTSAGTSQPLPKGAQGETDFSGFFRGGVPPSPTTGAVNAQRNAEVQRVREFMAANPNATVDEVAKAVGRGKPWTSMAMDEVRGGGFAEAAGGGGGGRGIQSARMRANANPMGQGFGGEMGGQPVRGVNEPRKGIRQGVSSDLVQDYKDSRVNVTGVVKRANEMFTSGGYDSVEGLNRLQAAEDLLLDHGQAAAIAKNQTAYGRLNAERVRMFGDVTTDKAARDQVWTDARAALEANAPAPRPELTKAGGTSGPGLAGYTERDQARLTRAIEQQGEDAGLESAYRRAQYERDFPPEQGGASDVFGAAPPTTEEIARIADRAQYANAAGQAEAPFYRQGVPPPIGREGAPPLGYEGAPQLPQGVVTPSFTADQIIHNSPISIAPPRDVQALEAARGRAQAGIQQAAMARGAGDQAAVRAGLERGYRIVGNNADQTTAGMWMKNGVGGVTPPVLPFAPFHIHSAQFWAQYFTSHPALALGMAQVIDQFNDYGTLQLQGGNTVSGLIKMTTGLHVLDWAKKAYEYAQDVHAQGGNNFGQQILKNLNYNIAGNNAFVRPFEYVSGPIASLTQRTTNPLLSGKKDFETGAPLADSRDLLREYGAMNGTTGVGQRLNDLAGGPIPRNIVQGVTNPGQWVGNWSQAGTDALFGVNRQEYNPDLAAAHALGFVADQMGLSKYAAERAYYAPQTPEEIALGKQLHDAVNVRLDTQAMAKIAPVQANAAQSALEQKGIYQPRSEKAYMLDMPIGAGGFTGKDLLTQPGNYYDTLNKIAQAKAQYGDNSPQVRALQGELGKIRAADVAQAPGPLGQYFDTLRKDDLAKYGDQSFRGKLSPAEQNAYDAFNDLRGSADYKRYTELKAAEANAYGVSKQEGAAWYKANVNELNRVTGIVSAAEQSIVDRYKVNPKELANRAAVAAGRSPTYANTEITPPSTSTTTSGTNNPSVSSPRGTTAPTSTPRSTSSPYRTTGSGSQSTRTSRGTSGTSGSTSSSTRGSQQAGTDFFNYEKSITDKGERAALFDALNRAGVNPIGQKGVTPAEFTRALAVAQDAVNAKRAANLVDAGRASSRGNQSSGRALSLAELSQLMERTTGIGPAAQDRALLGGGLPTRSTSQAPTPISGGLPTSSKAPAGYYYDKSGTLRKSKFAA